MVIIIVGTYRHINDRMSNGTSGVLGCPGSVDVEFTFESD